MIILTDGKCAIAMKPVLHAFCVMACAVTLFASCMEDERMDTPQSGKVRMEFYAGMDAATRTQLVENNNVHWETDDAISLFDPSGTNNEFITRESGTSVTFTGTAGESAGTYYALYPYSADATIAGSIVTTTLPATQTAKAGSFASMLNPSVAVADAQHNLYFKNVCALVKFTLGGSTEVAKATLCGNNGEALAGTLIIDASADAPAATVDAKFGETVVELTGTLTSGSTYYFVVAPGTLSGGLTLTLYDGEGNFWKKTSNTSATLTAGRILNLGTLTPDTFTPSSGYEVTQDGVYHIYNAEGLMKWASDADVLNKNLVLENDIDLAGKTWIPIGTDMNTDGYSGEFDGNGKFIYNLSVENNDGNNVGFFGGLAAGGVVHDVKFDKASVTGSSSNTSVFVGVVAGSSLGKIEDCNVRNSEVSGYNAGAITGNNSLQVNGCNALDVQVTATYAAGGIAGANYGKVEYCTLSGNSRIEASGSSSRAGGIIGTSSKESGVLTSGRLLKCAVDGATISATWAGGIAGENSFGIVAQCIANRVTVTHNSSQPTSRLGGVVGYNTRGDVVASYSAYSTIGGQGLTSEAMGGIVGYNYSSDADVYGCYSTHVSILGSVSGSESGMGSIAGYTNGRVTSCYAILPDGVTGISLVGSGSLSDHCVDAGGTNYSTLIDNVPNLTAADKSVWEAAEIWDFTASGAPTIESTYICNPPATQP